MARSSYIYLVMPVQTLQDGGIIPIAAFTVKHELVSWLMRNMPSDNYRVWRVADGHALKGSEDITAKIQQTCRELEEPRLP